MRLEYESPEKIKSDILKIAGKHLDLNQYKLFFFGSRVIGKRNDRSDIDIGIMGAMPVSPAAFSEIEDEIENLPILYSIDIVDFSKVSEKFKQVALEKIEYIN